MPENEPKEFPDQPVRLELSDEAIRCVALLAAVGAMPNQWGTTDPLTQVAAYEDYLRNGLGREGEGSE